MDIRVIILAGTFALFVVALIIFIVTASRARREARFGTAPEMPEWTGISGSTGPLDTSLEGLDVRVAEDAPSAALLTPLKTGEWMPPESPAPAAELPGASLEERIAEYQPVPDIPEPAFAVERFQEWEVAPGATAPRAESVTPPAEWVRSIPEVVMGQPGAPVDQASVPGMSDEAEDFEQELAALLPTVEFSAIGGPQSAEQSATAPASQPELAPASAQAPVPQPVPVSTPAPAPAPEPVAAPVTAPAPEPVAAPAPEPEPVPVAATAHAPEPEPVVVPVVVPVDVPVVVQPPVTPPAPDMSRAVVEAPPVEPPAAISAFDLPAAATQVAALPDEAIVSPPEVLVTPVAAPAPDLPEAPRLDVVVPQAPAPAPVPVVPAAVPVPSPEPDTEGFWTEAMREQFAQPAPARSDRPAVTVAARPEPQPEPAVIEPIVNAKPRPIVRVHMSAGEEAGAMVTSPPVPSSTPDAPRRLAARSAPDVPEVVMVAPVEMWFGDARIGVKAGTPTYDRFRKYADVLFADLKTSQATRR